MILGNEHGSARFQQQDNVAKTDVVKEGGVILGHARTGKDANAIFYNGEQHIITKAPNRTGKGTSAIIPNLLEYGGAVLVIDPKGENAIVTANARRKMGQNVQIVDPWNIAVSRLNDEVGHGKAGGQPFQSACFNPLDMLSANSPDLVDDAMMIAETIVMETGGDSHWSTEAKAGLQGFIMHVVTSPKEAGRRNLGRVREIMSLPPQELVALIASDMARDGVKPVKASANRMMQKTEKEFASVMSTMSANTHILESPALVKSLEKSTFDFADLKSDDRPLTVYLVLPAERLQTHGRWLRILVSMALTSVVRTKGKPKKSALFILDEFAALGRLAMVEQAFGLMAGYGLQIWAILQDLSQLKDLYKTRWQTFIANAGVVQVFGVSDMETADYISKMLGQKTAIYENVSTSEGHAASGKSVNTSSSLSMHGRALMTPDELMKLPPNQQLLLFSGQSPLIARKVPYFSNARYYDPHGQKVKPVFDRHPDQPQYKGKLSRNDPKTFAKFGVDVNAKRDGMEHEFVYKPSPARPSWPYVTLGIIAGVVTLFFGQALTAGLIEMWDYTIHGRQVYDGQFMPLYTGALAVVIALMVMLGSQWIANYQPKEE